MSGPIASIKSDASRVRLLTADGDERWDAPALPEPGDTLAAMQQRIEAAASFIASNPGVRRRLRELVIDVDESECLWTRTVSLSPAVIASDLRRKREEWAKVFPVGGVHPLAQPDQSHTNARRLIERKQPPSKNQHDGRERGIAVLMIPDAAARLLLDALDRQSVRVQSVRSLFHKLADPSGASDRPTCAARVLLEPGERIVWAWGEEAQLLAGGRVGLHHFASLDDDDQAGHNLPGPIDTAAQRLALDWSSWAALLGRAPSSVEVIASPEHAESANRLAQHLSDTAHSAVAVTEHADPVKAVLTGATASTPPPRTGRSQLPRLTSRPTRSVRRRYLLAAATLAVGAAAIAGLGNRLQSAANNRAEAATAERQERLEWVADNLPGIEIQPNQAVVPALRAELTRITGQEPFVEPPAPRPLSEAMQAFFAVVTKPEYEGIVLRSLAIGEGNNDTTVTLGDVSNDFATELIADVRSIEGVMRWDLRSAGRDTQTFVGVWR